MEPISFTHEQEGPVFRIETLELDAAEKYEAALVHPLDPESCEAVNVLRSAQTVYAPPWKQLHPHLTLLFIGTIGGAALQRLLGALRPILQIGPTNVRFERYGWFDTDDGLGNLHICPDEVEPFRKTHLYAERSASGAGWIRVSPWSGDAYHPHVTIWDDVQREVYERVSDSALPFNAVLESPIVIGRRFDALEAS